MVVRYKFVDASKYAEKMNQDKTELTVFVSKQQPQEFSDCPLKFDGYVINYFVKTKKN